MFIDCHCHIDELKDIESSIEDARNANVGFLFSNSVDLDSIKKNLQLRTAYKEVKPCFGLHPSNLLHLKDKDKELNIVLEFIKDNIGLCYGIGETGLDYKSALLPNQKDLQKRAFSEFISLSVEYERPVIVHSRRAVKPVIELLNEGDAGDVLLHWFVANKTSILDAVDSGYFVSLGPSILFSHGMQDYALEIPLESLVLETDCPVPFNGKASSPDWIPEIAGKLAELHGIELRELEGILYKNSKKLYKF